MQLTQADLLRLLNLLQSSVRTTGDIVSDCQQALRAAETAHAEATQALALFKAEGFTDLYKTLPKGE